MVMYPINTSNKFARFTKELSCKYFIKIEEFYSIFELVPLATISSLRQAFSL